MRIALVQGTRPEIIKNFSIVAALARAGVRFEVLHTNQHRQRKMCADVYRAMGYEWSRALPGRYSLGNAIEWLQRTFVRDGITHVIVNGDTAASLAGALAALYLDLGVTHVEAGLRSGDVLMREERNRIMVDSIATLLFAYTAYEERLLRATPAVRGRIHLEGNTTVDVLHDFADAISRPPRSDRYVFVTLHRKELTDSRERMTALLHALRRIAERRAVVFPVHPRTADALRRYKLDRELGAIEAVDPVSPFESLALQKHALAILTDSGCIQEEAYLLGVPCVTLRNNTERHLTVANGANVVAGFAIGPILASVEEACAAQRRGWPDIYGPPGAGVRIVDRVLSEAAAAERRDPQRPRPAAPAEICAETLVGGDGL
ncbi:MAG TPA: UDP-N-acetylglucosamine 2-epimerase (non-hydrolyzing) [Gammaproteobacteria bacterium]